MKTTRRNLFKMLGLGAAAVAVPSVVPAKKPRFRDYGKRLPQSFIEHWEKRGWQFVPEKWN